MTLNSLTVRPLTGPAELDLFCRLPYVLNTELADDLAAGRRRPSWMWSALRGDRLVGRLAWWAPLGANEQPYLLDVFDLDDSLPLDEQADVAARLFAAATAGTLPAGTRPPEYTRFLPADWRDDAATRRAVETRMSALERTGARLFVERLRLEWRPGAPVPEPGGRLRFRPVAGRDDLLPLMALVLDGTLDAHSRRDVRKAAQGTAGAEGSGADAPGASVRAVAARVAAEQYDGEFLRYRSPREWWRIAELPSGEPAGFVVPAHNGYHHVIAYIGVLPAHRGQGLVDELLAEGTRVLAAEGAPRVRAATDLHNVPMARSFGRLGYVAFQREINMTW